MYSSNGLVLLCYTLTILLKTVIVSLSNFKTPDFSKKGADPCIQRQLNPTWQISFPSYPSQPWEESYKEN